ncbi:MAG: HD family phosphohydrolase [Acidobacteriota bacterium]
MRRSDSRRPKRPNSGLRGAPSTGSARARKNYRRYATALQDWCDRTLGKNVLWAGVLIVFMTPILSQQECSFQHAVYAVGEVARSTIRATYDIELPDEAATIERREAESRKVRPVYDQVMNVALGQQQKLEALFRDGRAALQAVEEESAKGSSTTTETELVAVRTAYGEAVSAEDFEWLAARGFSEDLEKLAVRVLSSIRQKRIVQRREDLPKEGAIAVREVRQREATEAELVRVDQIADLEQVRAAMRQRVRELTPNWSRKDRNALISLLGGFTVANLSYNASETEHQRDRARVSVPEVFMRIPRGQVIVREGEVFTKETVDLLSRIEEGRRKSVNWKGIGGSALLLCFLTIFLHRYIQAHLRVFKRVKNLYSMVLLVGLLTGVGSWIGGFLADAVSERILVTPFNDPSSYYWALPVSAGAIFVTLLANVRVAMVSASINAVLFGMVLGWDARAMVFALLSSFAGIYGISKYERRTAILKASAWVALVNTTLVLAINAVRGGHAPGSGLLEMGTAAAGGILVAPVVSFGLPILEWLFNVLTDIRLLELSNLDNPLLRRLSLEAPGTYNHSIILGTLAEQAAEEIGAHALFCRVAANYHDIGKMSKAEYFVENMRGGVNKHDKLSPRMSSLIIANHVKEGLRLADEFNLPKQIRDMIPQHHGTRLISFFYRKAKGKEDPDVPEIHESDYRYPGPKPQTKEAAIVMMADSVEAAARTIEDPTPAKFEELITTMSNTIVLDHQLDECDLTFSDLGRIRASFLKTLTAVHHHRISYPGFVFDRSKTRAVEAD